MQFNLKFIWNRYLQLGFSGETRFCGTFPAFAGKIPLPENVGKSRNPENPACRMTHPRSGMVLGEH